MAEMSTIALSCKIPHLHNNFLKIIFNGKVKNASNLHQCGSQRLPLGRVYYLFLDPSPTDSIRDPPGLEHLNSSRPQLCSKSMPKPTRLSGL